MIKIPLVKFDNGMYIDDKRIDGLLDVKIESNTDNFSEVSVKFICQVDGLDNIKPQTYSFKSDEPKREYKPKRKYLSR
ncbi:hypothetical protein D920_01736 [Enterococcus faecalis 13-SD-W-01]|nr:hypothetical protein D920_01736 [Enterococcus faecalis 13-SD-W-01]